MTKDELADRIEALEGPCRRIDECIQVALSGKDPLDYDGPFDAPEYTASLDAAMTLAKGDEAQIVNDALYRMGVVGYVPEQYTEYLARYVSAAALRAQ